MDGVVNAEKSIGVIGFVEGNGHPFSFSAIINGYESSAMREAGWSVIADYLDRQDRHDIGIPGAHVSCCWADDPAISEQIKSACRIDASVSLEEMQARDLDAVIIARDDWASHFPLAMPFLERGVPTFIDKPLTLSENELEKFEPYLNSGLLMSCSALRYARELDALRAAPEQIGRLQLITGAVPLSMSRYGIHLLEAILGVFDIEPEVKSVLKSGEQTHALMHSKQDVVISLHALGRSVKRFRLSFFGDEGSVEVDITDNFSAFRRALLHFFDQIERGRPAIPPVETRRILNVMMDIERA